MTKAEQNGCIRAGVEANDPRPRTWFVPIGEGRKIRNFFVVSIVATVLIFLQWPVFAEIAPDIQADLYLVQAESYIKRTDSDQAAELLRKIGELLKEHDLEMPAEVYFKYAQVSGMAGAHAEAIAALNHYMELREEHDYGVTAEVYFRYAQVADMAGVPAEAIASLHRYLHLTGRTGENYRQALELLVKTSEDQERAIQEVNVRSRRFRDCEECPELVELPAGSFIMGAPFWEEGRSESEGPVHLVTIGKPFAVGVYEVTFREWDACVSDGGCDGYRPYDEDWGRRDRPVINVSRDDSQAYLRWITERTGQEYRLLSEAEWEYVARAGTRTPFHTGASISTEQANHNSRDRTVEVGSFPANRFGLYDVHGNVWEWVRDCWHDSYAGAPTDGSAWLSGDCTSQVVRGGSWENEPVALRSAERRRNVIWPKYGRNNLGFRVARTVRP